MNVSQLHRALGKLIEAGHGRKLVAINKDTFSGGPLESDGAVIIAIEDVQGPIFVGKMDDDGGTAWNKDGSEAGTRTVVLRGGAQQ
jgi:hypothetical protein